MLNAPASLPSRSSCSRTFRLSPSVGEKGTELLPRGRRGRARCFSCPWAWKRHGSNTLWIHEVLGNKARENVTSWINTFSPDDRRAHQAFNGKRWHSAHNGTTTVYKPWVDRATLISNESASKAWLACRLQDSSFTPENQYVFCIFSGYAECIESLLCFE